MGTQHNRILLADSQTEVRSALRLLLEEFLGRVDIIEAAEGEELFDVVQATSPDLLLLDWAMLDAAAPQLSFLQHKFPNLRVVVLSGAPDVQEDAMAAGAQAFIDKGQPPGPLLNCLTKLLQEMGSTRCKEGIEDPYPSDEVNGEEQASSRTTAPTHLWFLDKQWLHERKRTFPFRRRPGGHSPPISAIAHPGLLAR